MVEIEDMTRREVREVLGRIGYAHLGCCRGDEPYVVPVHYAWDGESIFIYTTEGKKADIIGENPKVCLQAEEVRGNDDWTSVMAVGEAVQLFDEGSRKAALDLIRRSNPTLTPAISIRWMDSWVRENIEVIYQIRPRAISGRRTIKREMPSSPMLGKQKQA